MPAILALIQINQTSTLLAAIALFLIAIFMASKRWIGAKTTIILLLFSIIIGLFTGSLQPCLSPASQISYSLQREDKAEKEFRIQLLKAVEEVKKEISSERESLDNLRTQVQDISNTLENQKQKLRGLVEKFEKKESVNDLIPSKEESSL